MAVAIGARWAVLGLLRVLGFAVAIGAVAAGVVYAVSVATGGPVWVADPTGFGGTFAALPAPLAAVHVAAFVAGCLTVAGIALLVGDLAWRVRRRVEFAPAVSRTAWALAIVLGVGSWLARILATIAAQSGLVYPDDVDPATVRLADLPIGWSIGAQSFLPDAALLGLAIVLAVLAYLLRAGERLQRDVEGLV